MQPGCSLEELRAAVERAFDYLEVTDSEERPLTRGIG
jgi:hypothetical protein